MTRVRPCKRDCGYPALKGRQFCKWHALMRMSSDEQADAAAARLREYDGSWEAHLQGARRATVHKSEWPTGERWCAGCQSFVPLFYCSGSRCKACTSAASHAKRLEDNYGIDAATYARILRKQGGRCGICRNVPRTIRFAVDHDHKTGAVRGILCKRCNHDLLGGAHDDVKVLYKAMEYLLFPPAQYDYHPAPERVLAALAQALRPQKQPVRPEPQDAPF